MAITDFVSTKLDTLVSAINQKEDRDYSYLHPSEIGDCGRKMYYKVKGIKPMVPPPPQTLRIFGNGHFMHQRYQMYLRDAGILAKEKIVAMTPKRLLLGLSEVDRIVIDGATGRSYHYDPDEWVWKVVPSGSEVPYVGGMEQPHQVRARDLALGDEIWMVEVPLFNQEYHLGGHADAIVRTPEGAAVIDFKSTNENNFAYLFHNELRMDEYHLSYPHKHFQTCHICGDTINRWKDYVDHLVEQHMSHISVDPKHRTQLNVYMWLLGLDKSILLHENKNTQMVVSEQVDRDDTLVAQIQAKAVSIWRHVEAGDPPDRPYSSRSKFPCAWCDFVSHCWS